MAEVLIHVETQIQCVILRRLSSFHTGMIYMIEGQWAHVLLGDGKHFRSPMNTQPAVSAGLVKWS